VIQERMGEVHQAAKIPIPDKIIQSQLVT